MLERVEIRMLNPAIITVSETGPQESAAALENDRRRSDHSAENQRVYRIDRRVEDDKQKYKHRREKQRVEKHTVAGAVYVFLADLALQSDLAVGKAGQKQHE